MELNLVESWVKKDPARWIAGALAGLFAGLAMLAFAVILFALLGYDAWAPVKIAAVPFLGGEAMAYGNTQGLIFGFVVHELFSMFIGFVFGHFVFTNSLPGLLGMGLTWGIFAWIFLNNLYFNSWREYFVVEMPRGAGFFSLLVFGISLTSVAFFDRMVRRRKR